MPPIRFSPSARRECHAPNILATKTSALDLLGILGNVLWLVLAGWWLALAHVVTAILLAITIVGIPFAWAPLGVAKVMQCLCAYFPIVESAAACSAALSRLRRE